LTNLHVVRGFPVLRILLRRSKAEGGQEHSLDTQRAGALRFAELLRQRQPPVPWDGVVDYIDDGVAGDDFDGRRALHRLLAEAQPGDVVVCRDHSRLGRDAIDAAVTVRELVRERRVRLYYYSTGQEVAFQTAIDSAMAFIQGVGAQLELEAIRSRTKEALRERVRAGRIAGGRCFGYRLERRKDESGRPYTVAVVHEPEAEVVRWIFDAYLEGHGIKAMAADLNRRGILSPSAGRRGTGSWDPSAVREILRRERYRGVYVHGQKERTKKGGKRIARLADPAQVLRVEVPDWRIVDDVTWERVAAELPRRGALVRAVGQNAKHPLAGLARCTCGGSIGARNTKVSGGVRAAGYGCSFHSRRGSAVCEVALVQPVEEVEAALVDGVRAAVLAEGLVEQIVADVRAEVEREAASPTDTAALETELERLKGEQKRYAAAIAQAPDVDALIVELRRRSDRIKTIQAELAVAARLPLERRALLAKVEGMARAKLDALHASLAADREGLGEVLRAIFEPGSLQFTPTEVGKRTVWRIRGEGRVRPFDASTSACDPTGNRTRDCAVRGRRPNR
jgi:site-specific DNA recombinase